MTQQRSIIGIDETSLTTTTTPGWTPATMANYALVDLSLAANGLRESLYQRIVGNEEHPTTVRLGYYPQPNNRYNFSSRLNTFVNTKDEAIGLDIYEPGNITIAWSMPRTSVPDPTDLMHAFMNLASFLFRTDGGVFTSAVLDAIKFGILDVAEQSD